MSRGVTQPSSQAKDTKSTSFASQWYYVHFVNEVGLAPLACEDVRKERSGLSALGLRDLTQPTILGFAPCEDSDQPVHLNQARVFADRSVGC